MDKKDSQSSLHTQKTAWRKALIDKRQNLADRAWRNDLLQRVMRVWLIERPEAVIGAYWPIKGEFDPLPALFRWQEAGLEEDARAAQRQRRISLPVVDKVHKTLTFHTWFPGCPMEEDAYGIPKPKDTEVVVRSEVRGRGEPVQLDYRLEKTPSGWKIYDLNVLGVWLVETYRTQFAQEINAKGIDGLIETLSQRNKSNNTAKAS